MTAILYVSQLPSAGSAAATDLVPLTQGSSGPGTGTTRTVTVAQLMQAAATALPTSLPGTAGVLWNNGGVLCIS